MKSFKLNRKGAWQKAGPNDLVELQSPGGAGHGLFYKKNVLHYLTLTIAEGGCLHLSGNSGSGKTSLIEAVANDPENWRHLCLHNGIEHKPLNLFRLAAYNFDSPNEVWHRRAINANGTYDEIQQLIVFIEYAIEHPDEGYFAVNIMEIGRMRPQIQNALVHLITRGDIINPLNGNSIGRASIAYIADSNYVAAEQHDFLLAEKDTALFNRINETGIEISHLGQEEEFTILKSIKSKIGCRELPDELLEKITYLGHLIRREQLENGALTSINPVSMRQYMSFMKKAARSNMPPEELVEVTLFALASKEDRSTINELKSYVFGINQDRLTVDEMDEIPY